MDIGYALLHNVYMQAGVVVLVCLAVVIRSAVIAWKDASKLDQEERGLAERFLEPLLNPLLQNVGPRGDIQVRELKQQLAMAGMRDENAVERFTMQRAVSLGVAVALLVMLALTGVDFFNLMLLGGIILLFGIRMPVYIVESRIKGRQTRISRALPSMVDLMVLCLDVGLSIEAAFDRVTAEVSNIEPLLGEEANLMSAEITAGLTFPNALRRMADRIGLEELITLARLISQANALGASITQALREYSEASLQRRLMNLEEQAGKISANLIMPVTMCMLPAALIALGGPAIILVAKVLEHMN